MKTIARLIKEFRTKWGFRALRRKSADRAASVACRIALNGCRI